MNIVAFYQISPGRGAQIILPANITKDELKAFNGFVEQKLKEFSKNFDIFSGVDPLTEEELANFIIDDILLEEFDDYIPTFEDFESHYLNASEKNKIKLLDNAIKLEKYEWVKKIKDKHDVS